MTSRRAVSLQPSNSIANKPDDGFIMYSPRVCVFVCVRACVREREREKWEESFLPMLSALYLPDKTAVKSFPATTPVPATSSKSQCFRRLWGLGDSDADCY